MRAKVVAYVDDGDVSYLVVRCGKKSKTFHRREFADGDSMGHAAIDWALSHKATSMAYQNRPLSGEKKLKDCIMNGLILNDIVNGIAVMSKGLETWADFDTAVLEEIAVKVGMHVSYVEGIFDKVSKAFTPAAFCELAPSDDGLNRIRDAIYGNTRAERMTAITL